MVAKVGLPSGTHSRYCVGAGLHSSEVKRLQVESILRRELLRILCSVLFSG